MRIQRQSESFAYRLAFQYELPQDISVTGHPFRKSKGLADEVLEQDGPAILWKALKDRWPGDHHYVARGEDGTIHGVLKGHWGKDRFNVSDLYSSIKAPSGTGNHLLRTVAQEAMSQGKGLRVINMLNDARPYWEGMGAQTEYNNAHASWSPEGLQALVNGDTIMSPNTEGTMMHNQPIPREHRLPGSAREIAWGRRRLPRSAGKSEWREARFWKQSMPAPKSLRFQPHPDYPEGRAAQAFDGDKEIGRLSWDDKNTVEWITTHPEYRGHGVASQLFDWAKQNMVPDIQHSENLTPSGEAFARSKGFVPPKNYLKQPPIDDSEDWPEAQTGQGAQWQGPGWKDDWYKNRMWEMNIEGLHDRVERTKKIMEHPEYPANIPPETTQYYIEKSHRNNLSEYEKVTQDPRAQAYLKQYLSAPE